MKPATVQPSAQPPSKGGAWTCLYCGATFDLSEMKNHSCTIPEQIAPCMRSAFQNRVQPWLMECFGPMIAGDREERNHRFLEESIELVQACGCSRSEAHQLVDYVFNRPVGEPPQEVGGVMVTLAALCLANGMDMHDAGELELARIWTKVEQIRAKQAAKPKHSPLPEATGEAARNAMRDEYYPPRAPLLNWDEWRGDFNGRKVMWTKSLLSWRGYKVDLHKFVDVDAADCFHTHPAPAIRIILWGGYVEQMEDGSTKRWRPGMVGIVRPALSHRAAALLNGRCSYSLWLRGKKTGDKIELRGKGWPTETERQS